MYRILAIAIALVGAAPLMAQRQPQTAHVNMYFPQLADGGPRAGQWQTSFTFVNASLTDAELELEAFDDNGQPLSIDFGAGSKPTHTVTIPAFGSRTLQSRIASPAVRVGWARAYSSVPVQASSSFRLWVNGQALQEVTAPPALPALDYISYANRDLGVAIANPSPDRSIAVDLLMVNAQGVVQAGPSRVSLPPMGHTAFNVKDKFPGTGYEDWTLVAGGATRPEDMFVAWTMNADRSGTFSSLPSGGVTYPLSHRDRIWNVHLRVLEAARRLDVLTTSPSLQILGGKEVNAYAAGGTTVAVTLGLSQLINDSDSELAAVMGHELGHIYQQRNGGLKEFHSNPEIDADMWGALLAVSAGYDPYGMAGALAKLSMATGSAGLTTQFEQQLSSDAHKSFNTRLQSVYEMLVDVCNNDNGTKQICSEYKRVFHPNLPDAAPLAFPNPTRRPSAVHSEDLRQKR